MRITKITAYAVKAEQVYAMNGAARVGDRLPGSDYLRMGRYPQLYSRYAQAALVRVETDAGVVGWGEAQAPIGTEIILTIIKEVLGPSVLGRDAEATAVRHSDMYEGMRVRGQIGGYQQDAIAAIDTALWDIRGRAVGRSLAELLGGRRRDLLPAYVTGLRTSTPEARREEAAAWAAQGLGVKPCLGQDYRADACEIEGLRAAMGDNATLLVDAMWGYTHSQALYAGRVFQEHGVGFLESPLPPEDVAGHAHLAAALDLPVAVGEPLRTRYQFLPWINAGAMDVVQPDVMRNGVTETVAVTELAVAHHLPVALHTGVVTVVGMAATVQLASAIQNFHLQEFQPVMLATFNPWIDQPIEVRDGAVVVPTGPGLGIEVDEARVRATATEVATVGL